MNDLQTWLTGLAKAVAAAAVLRGGTVIITSNRTWPCYRPALDKYNSLAGTNWTLAQVREYFRPLSPVVVTP